MLVLKSIESLAPDLPEATQKPLPGGRLNRRRFLAAAGACSLMALLRPSESITQTISAGARQWSAFRDRFMERDGRIVDSGNGGISHSEGQGIGMLAAARFDDRAAFDLMRNWTRATLMRPFDALHAWRFRPNVAHPVDDLNNATDGDLLIALALFNGAVRWDDSRLHDDAMAITREVLGRLVVETAAGLMLLPGLYGFAHGPSITINPSYLVFPALQAMSAALPDPAWNRLLRDGLAMLHVGRFGQWDLPTDWLVAQLGVPLQPAVGWPARFSYDAVRIPLYLAWSGMSDDPVVGSITRFWASHPDQDVPAWADVQLDAVSPYPQSSGMIAVRRYVAAMRTKTEPVIPHVEEASDYYSAALTMLTHIALSDPASVGS